METYAKQSKSSARTLSARAGHGQPDMATILQAYRNRTAQLAALTDDDEQALQGKFTTQLQEDDDEAIQGKFVTQLQSDDDEEPLQGKFLTQLQSAEEEEPLQQKAENRTGLPDQLKSGVENLSGYSLDAVKVHYNSPKPAQLQALAYTQGTDIHVGPGQERYLGHEAWHVVQQMQGRVQPTTQLQGVAVNDNEGLEREADVMGEKVVTQLVSSKRGRNLSIIPFSANLVQRLAIVGNAPVSGIYKERPFTGNQVFVSVAQVGSLFGHAEIVYEDKECINKIIGDNACFGVMELTAGMSQSSARKGGSMSTGMGIMSSSSSTVSYTGGDASKSSHSSGSGSTSSNAIGEKRKFQFKKHFINPRSNELHIIKNQTKFILSISEFKQMEKRFAEMNGAIDQYHYKLFSRGRDQSDLNCATFVMHLLGGDFYLNQDGNEMSKEAVVTPYDVAKKVARRPVEEIDVGNLFD